MRRLRESAKRTAGTYPAAAEIVRRARALFNVSDEPSKWNGERMKTVLLVLNLVGAALSLLSAWHWYRSARTTLPAIDASTGKPKGPVEILIINKTLVEGAAANKLAAGWTAAATLTFALSAIVGAVNGS